jgi:hypothetical protein
MENKEIIKEYFVEVNEDKFTKVKFIKAKHSIDLHYDGLFLDIEFRQKDNVDGLFFIVKHISNADNSLNLRNLSLYIIIDNDITLSLLDSKYIKDKEIFNNIYISSAQLSIDFSEFKYLAGGTKVEYSLRVDDGKIEGDFSYDNSILLKGFYNAVFDPNFEIESLLKFMDNYVRVSDIFKLNTPTNNYIITPQETSDRVISGSWMIVWTLKEFSSEKGKVIFGLSPNNLDKQVEAVFTTKGIYTAKGKVFVGYEKIKEVKISKNFFGMTKISDSSSGLSIDLVTWPIEEGQKLIDFINQKISEI